MRGTHLLQHRYIFPCIFGIALLCGCERKTAKPGSDTGPVVLYTSVDEPYVRPLVERFQNQTGIRVTLLTDSEASKSVGLAGKLEAEKDHPKADAWWDNECFLSQRLADEGVLAPYDSPSASDIPAQYKDARHLWAGSVLRVRVLVLSGQSSQGARPAQLTDLLRPEFKGRVGIARPTAGTTGGHVAAMYVAWGADRADDFFRKLHDNGVILLGGNSVVAESVARGDLALGLCDNDDAASAASEIGNLQSALPDQGPGDQGTLAMPCAVALVARGPNPARARRLIDFLLSPQTDRALIDAKFAWCSARDTSHSGKFMKVDYGAVAKRMPEAIRTATAILEGQQVWNRPVHRPDASIANGNDGPPHICER